MKKGGYFIKGTLYKVKCAFISFGGKRGFVTFEEINELFHSKSE